MLQYVRSYDDSGKVTWTTNVKILLYKSGFGHVWLSQGVGLGDETMFLKFFKQRLSDCFTHEWHRDITSSHKLNYFANCKYKLEPERSLNWDARATILLYIEKVDNIPKEERLSSEHKICV